MSIVGSGFIWNFYLVSYHNPADLPEIPSTVPAAGFSYAKNGLEVTFTNTSTNSTSYMWDFGDGNTSTDKDPVHTYAAADAYTVTLTAMDDLGKSDEFSVIIDLSGGPSEPAPTPTYDPANVISIFSDAYTNVAGTDFNPNWGQATGVTQDLIDGNNTLHYTGLNYQGIALGSNQDVSGMTYLHLDFWTTSSTALNVFVISPGNEIGYPLTVPTTGWTSIDIPLSEFVPPVNLADVFQFKFDGNGEIYLDNILFRN
ncbi:MAG: PKD domain-containing protein [Saprospirales bacterium]|nr:PKD domain-containing protein [Saprospirales bacterium]MBK8492996.1 PKD domain-containing protein [Saprospirales bacterium]